MKFEEDEDAVGFEAPVAVVEGRSRNLAGLRVYPSISNTFPNQHPFLVHRQRK